MSDRCGRKRWTKNNHSLPRFKCNWFECLSARVLTRDALLFLFFSECSDQCGRLCVAAEQRSMHYLANKYPGHIGLVVDRWPRTHVNNAYFMFHQRSATTTIRVVSSWHVHPFLRIAWQFVRARRMGFFTCLRDMMNMYA